MFTEKTRKHDMSGIRTEKIGYIIVVSGQIWGPRFRLDTTDLYVQRTTQFCVWFFKVFVVFETKYFLVTHYKLKN